jgi:hypothetical protein
MKNAKNGLDRRGFLTLWGVGLAGISLPAWMAVELAAPGRKASLEQALERAARGGRPLLVLLFPADAGERMSIGEAWGQLVRFGSDQALADLALCDLACAELSLVRQVRPALEGVPLGDVLALLIEPGSRRVRTVEADLTITTALNLWEEGGMEQYEAQAATRVERMASA